MKQSVHLFLMCDIPAKYFLLVCHDVLWRLSNSINRLLPQDLRSQSFKPTSLLDLSPQRISSVCHPRHKFFISISLRACSLTISSAHCPTLFSTTVILSDNIAKSQAHELETAHFLSILRSDKPNSPPSDQYYLLKDRPARQLTSSGPFSTFASQRKRTSVISRGLQTMAMMTEVTPPHRGFLIQCWILL